MKSESTREVSYGNSRSDTQRYLRLSFTSHSISIILREYYTACKKTGNFYWIIFQQKLRNQSSRSLNHLPDLIWHHMQFSARFLIVHFHSEGKEDRQAQVMAILMLPQANLQPCNISTSNPATSRQAGCPLITTNQIFLMATFEVFNVPISLMHMYNCAIVHGTFDNRFGYIRDTSKNMLQADQAFHREQKYFPN